MNPVDRRKHKANAHSLKPVVMVGQFGLTEAVFNEIEIALNVHELIKIKVRAEREQRKDYAEKICTQTGAELIQSIGQIIVIYRLNPNK